jgi:hypothetical protein
MMHTFGQQGRHGLSRTLVRPGGVMVPMLVALGACGGEYSLWDVPTFDPFLPEAGTIVSVPVYGGTLESAPALGGIVAADPEGDRLLQFANGRVTATDLGAGTRPFRVLVEGLQAFVTLRGTGELAAVDLTENEVRWRTRLCLEPRGVARSPAGPLVVACAGGSSPRSTTTGTCCGSCCRTPISAMSSRSETTGWSCLGSRRRSS